MKKVSALSSVPTFPSSATPVFAGRYHYFVACLTCEQVSAFIADAESDYRERSAQLLGQLHLLVEHT
jgi:hypothetical protein